MTISSPLSLEDPSPLKLHFQNRRPSKPLIILTSFQTPRSETINVCSQSDSTIKYSLPNPPTSRMPSAPYTVTRTEGGAHLALATVGALSHNHPMVQSWKPFARNDTRYRNVILIGQDADAEWRFLANNPHFTISNLFNFATVGAILDCQQLYIMLHPETYGNKIGLENLIRYCFPDVDVTTLRLHNAVSNPEFWH